MNDAPPEVRTSLWTGGQYSILRVATALGVALLCRSRLDVAYELPAALLVLGMILSVGLALGWRDRAVTLNLILILVGVAHLVDGVPSVYPKVDLTIAVTLLTLHLTTPVAPYGSWDARDRIDPRGDWSRSRTSLTLSWLGVSVLHVIHPGLASGHSLMSWTGTIQTNGVASWVSIVAAILVVSFVVSIFSERMRPYTWTALTLWVFASTVAASSGLSPFASASSSGGWLLLAHFFACDPGWWPGRTGRAHRVETQEEPGAAQLFYDGDCGFCQNSIRLILAEENATPERLRLRFAPLQSDLFGETLEASREIDRKSLPDSIVVVLPNGRILVRSDAALEVASRLGGLWRAIALLAGLLPRSLRDSAYDGIASVRKRLAAAPKDACPILPPDLRSRFDA